MAVTQPRSITEPIYFRTGLSEEVAQIAKGYILKPGTAVDSVMKATGSTDELLGVSVEPMDPGVQQSYQVDGKVPVLSGAAIVAGVLLTADSTGRAVTASGSATSTARILGRAVTGCSGAGEWVECELSKGSIAFIGTATVATIAALKAITAGNRFTGQLMLVQADGSLWRFSATAAQAADGANQLVLVPDAGTGRWLRANQAFTMKVPLDFSMADGATIFTVPENFTVRLTGLPYWEVTSAWTGGSSSSIGIASNKSGYNTAGDILGGAAGDVAATLVAGTAPGTIGPKLDTLAEIQAFLMEEGDTLTYEEITSAFTTGAGFVCVPVSVVSDAPATP